MSWTAVQDFAVAAADTINGTQTLTITKTFTVGNRVVLGVYGSCWNSSLPAPTTPVVSVSDSLGNTVNLDAGSTNINSPVGTNAMKFIMAWYSFQVTTGGSDTITVSIHGGTADNVIGFSGTEYSGLDTSASPVDVSHQGTATGTNSGTQSTGSTANAAASNELDLAMAIDDGAGDTIAVNSSSPTVTKVPALSNDASNFASTCVARGNSTGAATCSAVFSGWASGTADTDAIIVVYKLAPPTIPPPPAPPPPIELFLNQFAVGEALLARHAGIPDTARFNADYLYLTDTVARGLSLSRSNAENLGLVDSTSAIGPRGRNVSDNLGLVDATTRATSLPRSTANNLQLTDTASANVSDPRTTSENLGLVDSISSSTSLTSSLQIPQPPVMFLLAQFGLPFPGSPTIYVSAVLSANVSDNLGLTDSTVANVTVARTGSDNLGLTDGVTIIAPFVPAPPPPIPPTIILGQYGITQAYLNQPKPPTSATVVATQNVNDSLGLTNATTANMVEARSPSDNLGLTDTVSTATGNTPRPVSDNLGLTDSTLANLAAVRTVADLLSLIDGVPGRMLVAPRIFTEHLGLVDVTTGPSPPASSSRLSIDLDSGHLIYRLGA